MNKLAAIIISFVAFLAVTCTTQQKQTTSAQGPTKMRQIKPAEVRSFHQPIDLTIAWYPYKNMSLQRTSDSEWQVVQSDSTKEGVIPVILIRYPATKDSIWLDMNTESAMLGKLLKHSLMTQEPIKRPFDDYLQAASCTKCHPPEVKVDFEK